MADRGKVADTGLLLVACLAGGLIGWWSGIPAGPLLFSMLGAIAVQRVKGGVLAFPRVLTVSARALIGVAAGSLVGPDLVAGLGGVFGWAVLLLSGLILGSLILGGLAHRLLRVDRPSSLVALAPGGLVELSSLAVGLRLRLDIVLAIHLLRRLMVVALVLMLVAGVLPS